MKRYIIIALGLPPQSFRMVLGKDKSAINFSINISLTTVFSAELMMTDFKQVCLCKYFNTVQYPATSYQKNSRIPSNLTSNFAE